ncbi:MAG: 50S ribosomal protein L29 [Candidatus Bathyarchaeia archaeon]
MPLIRVKEIREMSPEERNKKLTEFKTELVRLKTMVKAGGTVENPARIKELRRAIARILTVERAQKLETKASKKGEKGK